MIYGYIWEYEDLSDISFYSCTLRRLTIDTMISIGRPCRCPVAKNHVLAWRPRNLYIKAVRWLGFGTHPQSTKCWGATIQQHGWWFHMVNMGKYMDNLNMGCQVEWNCMELYHEDPRSAFLHRQRWCAMLLWQWGEQDMMTSWFHAFLFDVFCSERYPDRIRYDKIMITYINWLVSIDYPCLSIDYPYIYPY